MSQNLSLIESCKWEGAIVFDVFLQSTGTRKIELFLLVKKKVPGTKKILFNAFPKEESTQMWSILKEFYDYFQISFSNFWQIYAFNRNCNI